MTICMLMVIQWCQWLSIINARDTTVKKTFGNEHTSFSYKMVRNVLHVASLQQVPSQSWSTRQWQCPTHNATNYSTISSAVRILKISNRTVTSGFDSIPNEYNYSKFSNTYHHQLLTLKKLKKASFLTEWRRWTEHQSVRMSKITKDGLTRSGTGCFIAVPVWQQWASNG